jgi:hypothetical protein
MREFPQTAEEFYALRDDRTNRCVTARDYQQTKCLVTIDDALLDTLAGQVMLVTACNLLSRWCRSVAVVIPQGSPHPQLALQEKSLGDAVLAQMHDADPFGRFEILRHSSGPGDVLLHIGDRVTASAARQVAVNASGWYAALSHPLARPVSPPPAFEDGNCIGALAAACLGVAQVFKHALNYPQSALLAEGVFDLFRLTRLKAGEVRTDYPFTPEPNLGRILMVGAGSVGSAAAYCLSLLRATCDMTIVDGDVVKIENFNRSPIFGKSCLGLNKAEAVAASLRNSPADARSFDGWWEDFVRVNGRAANDFDLWLPLANEHGVRWSMQNNVPPLMIHASTTANWGVNHGRHIPGRDDCLMDRFPQDVVKENLECSTASVKTVDASVDAALPFLSLLGGVLIVADLMRLQTDGYPQVPNFALLDLGGNFDHIQAWNRKPRPGCICKSYPKALHEKINGNTRYANFSANDGWR